MSAKHIYRFYVLLTMHLSIFMSVINQLYAQKFCFTISLFHAFTCFEHMCSSSGVQNLYYRASGIITPIGGRPVHETATYRCDDTRGCVMQFWSPDDEHMCSKHVEAWNKTYCNTKILCIKLVNYWDKHLPLFVLVQLHVSLFFDLHWTINTQWHSKVENAWQIYIYMYTHTHTHTHTVYGFPQVDTQHQFQSLNRLLVSILYMQKLYFNTCISTT